MAVASVFISYCHQDVDPGVLGMILEDLAEQNGLEVISDRLAQVGDDLERFMSLIRRCHAVVVLCTPEYHRRVLTESKSVYFEYQAIVETYEKTNRSYDSQHRKVQRSGDPLKSLILEIRDERFPILPVLLSGTVEESIPAFFRQKVASDLTGMTSTRWRSTGKSRPQKTFRNLYDTVILGIGGAARDTLAIRQSDKDEPSQKVFNQVFFDLKHHPGTFDVRMMSRLFVKTLEFRRVSAQQSYVLVGRKGSGKSTLADFVTHGPSERWKPPVLYNVDDLPLEYLYSEASSSQHRSDQKYVVIRSKLMQFAWEAMFHYLCLTVLIGEYESNALSSLQMRRLEPLQNKFAKLNIDDTLVETRELLNPMTSSPMAEFHGFLRMD